MRRFCTPDNSVRFWDAAPLLINISMDSSDNTLLNAASVVLTEESGQIAPHTFYIAKDGDLYFVDSIEGNKVIAYRAKGWNAAMLQLMSLRKPFQPRLASAILRKFNAP